MHPFTVNRLNIKHTAAENKQLSVALAVSSGFSFNAAITVKFTPRSCLHAIRRVRFRSQKNLTHHLLRFAQSSFALTFDSIEL